MTMRRRMPGQKVERLLLKVKQQVEPITEALLAFASDHETECTRIVSATNMH